MSATRRLAFMFFMTAAASHSAQAGFVSLLPVDDGYQRLGAFPGLFTNETNLHIGGRPTFELRLGLEFDISSLPDDAIVHSAVLSLTSLGASAAQPASSVDFSLHGFAGDGVLTTADFAANNVIAGPFQSSFDSSRTPGFILADLMAVEVTALVQTLHASSESFALFTAKSDSFQRDMRQFFASKENPSQSARPYLHIEYSVPAAPVPEPSTAVLIVLGAASVGGYRLRRRTQDRALTQ
jgi:hypothetical protein